MPLMKYRPPILLLAAIAALPPLAIDMYLPAIPVIADFFNADIELMLLSLSIFLAGFSGGMLLFGPLSDRYGRRPLAIFGLCGFIVSSLLIAATSTTTLFLVGRLLQGLLGAAATVTVPAMVRDCYGKDTARGISTVTIIMLLAPLVAPMLGSLMLVFGPWQLHFYFKAAYALLLLGLALAILPETRPPENQAKRPSLMSSFLSNYWTILSRRRIYFDLLTSLCSALAFFTYLTAVSFIYISYFGISESLFGMLFALSAGSLIVVNYINMRLVSSVGSRRILHTGLSVAMVASVALLVFNLFGLGVYFTVVAFTLIVGGLGLSWVNADSLVLMEFPHQASSAAAVIGTLRFGTGAMAGPLLAWSFNNTPLPASWIVLGSVTVALSSQLVRGWIWKQRSPEQTDTIA